MGSSGCLVQAVMPANAIDAPISLRNPRRDTPSSHSDAPLGNSRCIISRNSSLPASSSRLRQYSGPLVSAIALRIVSRSSLFFLPGQTSSRCCLPLVSSIFIASGMSIPLALSDRLSMTCVATGYIAFGPKLVRLHQVKPERILIEKTLTIHNHRTIGGRRLISHIEHLVARPEILLRCAVTVQAPLHLQ